MLLHNMVVALHVNVPQELIAPAAQTPAPLQVPAVVCTRVIELHIGAPHAMAAGAAGQEPVPLQVVAAIDDEVSALQDAVRQTLPLFSAHAPLAAHSPLFPQPVALVSAVHDPSLVPTGTLVQNPLVVGRLQAWQAPAQVVLQQTPSTQLGAELPQSEELLHIAPCAWVVPHWLVTVLQITPAMQSLLEAQVFPH